ncbi:MAG: tetratricopeptide repeat protein [Cocleimonas sp.]|nr:tetratricopeptide repeat protein [Cocleimonas sp.]
MSELKTDEEKAEELKQWWRDNGTSVAAGIALAVAGTFGWQQWQANKITTAKEASALFSQIKTGTADKDSTIKQLTNDYSETPYATLASLQSAKQADLKKENKAAITSLRIAVKTSQLNIARIAKLRLIRMLIADNQLKEANTLLNEALPIAYHSLVDELKGDLHLAKKDPTKAREFYNRAILSAGSSPVQYLKMKRNNLGEGA